MSEVFIPLGGAGGKNRGEGVQVDENYTYLKMGTLGVGIPLPAGNYKALKAVHGEQTPFSSYGDGKNAAVFMAKDFLKKVTLDYFGIASITNFSLSMYAHRQVRLTWAVPSEGLWSGVHFVFKYGSMPTDENDGFMFYDSADVHYETPKLEERELYVRAYSYVTTNEGRWYDDGKVSATIRVSGISGSVTFGAGAGTWTVPEGVRRIRYILVGRGGDGGSPSWNYSDGQCGGGGGGYFTTGYMDVSPDQSLPWAVPTGQGQGTALNGVVANSGESAQTVITGRTTWNSVGGRGGSGGGGGTTASYKYASGGGAGGSNGANGAAGDNGFSGLDRLALGGVGQGTSTRGFNGVLYSGGGGGSRSGVGGAGGGGNGAQGGLSNGVNGIAGLGGGGGAGGYYNPKFPSSGSKGGQGGTGCIYIAWGSLMNDGS